jgi:hypothetical protein
VTENPVYAATEILFAARHRLPGDVIRSLDSILFCASAALYGQAEGFEHDPDEYGEHDVQECEAENEPEREPQLPADRLTREESDARLAEYRREQLAVIPEDPWSPEAEL